MTILPSPHFFLRLSFSFSLVCASILNPQLSQAATTDGLEPFKPVIIRPARSEIAKIVQADLKNIYFSATPKTGAYKRAQQRYFLYGARGFEPFWLTQNDAGKVSFSPAAASIITMFEKSYMEGFDPADYLSPSIKSLLNSGGTDNLAAVEVAFTASTLLYANHAAGGRITPTQVSKLITLRPQRVNEADLLAELLSASDPAAVLNKLHPKHKEFQMLRDELARHFAGAVEVIAPISTRGKYLRNGVYDDRVPVLRERLGLTISGEHNPRLFDDALELAVEAYQAQNNLSADGIAGPRTLGTLNGNKNTISKSDLIANMERWRWMPKELGNFHVFVNIPQYQVEVHEGDAINKVNRVVVGSTRNQTPIFSDKMEYVVVNPYWNVPRSILTQEMMPRIASDPSYLANRNYELLNASGRIVDARSVDWSTVSSTNPRYRVRQRPGSRNALGKMKFIFPNQHAVYLHDTPSKSLFKKSYRAYSHGCVRVHLPLTFAEALSRANPNISAGNIENLFGPKERTIHLDNDIPVHLAYFTVRVNNDGKFSTYGDVYGHNKRLKSLLASKSI